MTDAVTPTQRNPAPPAESEGWPMSSKYGKRAIRSETAALEVTPSRSSASPKVPEHITDQILLQILAWLLPPTPPYN